MTAMGGWFVSKNDLTISSNGDDMQPLGLSESNSEDADQLKIPAT